MQVVSTHSSPWLSPSLAHFPTPAWAPGKPPHSRPGAQHCVCGGGNRGKGGVGSFAERREGSVPRDPYSRLPSPLQAP